MLNQCLILVSILLTAAAAAFAQQWPPGPASDIVTDRPDVTESSIVVPKGSLQLENGFTWTTDHSRQLFDLSETLIRFGVTSRTELRVVAPNYFDALSNGRLAAGFGDIALGFKQQLGPLPHDFELSVIVAVSLPTGAARVSSHGLDPFIKFPWSRELKRGWSIGGMQSFFWNTDDRLRISIWEPTFYLEKEISKPLAAFVEYAADVPSTGGSRQIVHFGAGYKMTPRQLLDFHFGFGLTHAAPDHFFALGYSFRLDRLFSR